MRVIAADAMSAVDAFDETTYGPRGMNPPTMYDPAAISANPAVTMMRVVSTAPDKPAASANGTVRPSAMPMTMSRTVAVPVKWRSMWGICGIRVSDRYRGQSCLTQADTG